MTDAVPDHRRYRETHEWIATGEPPHRVGLTPAGADDLGEVAFVDPVGVGTVVAAGDPVAVVEGDKAVVDVHAPLAGTVAATNDDVVDHPSLLAGDPTGDGWLVALAPAPDADHDGLLDPPAYRRLVT